MNKIIIVYPHLLNLEEWNNDPKCIMFLILFSLIFSINLMLRLFRGFEENE